jgi:hypothetical protein
MHSKHLSIHTDAQTFLAAAGSMLYARETVNNLILGISERLIRDPAAYEDPFFATVSDHAGEICLAAVMTPPHNLILAGDSSAEGSYPILIEYFKSQCVHIPGVTALAEIADGFTWAWVQGVKERVIPGKQLRVYELREVHMSDPPLGTFQMACPADIPSIAQWIQAFEQEALGEFHNVDIDRAEKLVTKGQVFTWVVDGKLVSMAMKTRPIAHSTSVTGVYTPPEHRRQGYASALVANLSQYLLNEGNLFVNLFTDLDNPTTNKIYQAVGYHPVCDFRNYRFVNAPT